MARPATVVRSRRPSWAPEDAEELADISVWQTARVGSVEEGGYQLFSKRAQELVTNSSLRFGRTSFAVSKLDVGAAAGHGLSRRMARRSLDMSSLETLTTRYDESYHMETIHSPSSEILHPMRSLFLDKISSGSPPPELSPSPKSEQPPIHAPEDKNTDEHDQSLVSPSPLSELGEFEKRRQQEPEAVTKDQRCLLETGEEALAGQESVSHTSAARVHNVVMVVYDAERKPTTTGLEYAINNIVKEGDEIILVGYLQHVMSPMGHKMLADATQFIGVNEKCLKSETAEKKKTVEKMIDGRRQACEKRKIKLSSRISPGALPRSVVVREAKSLHATWVVFDRKALKEKKLYYVENLNCHVLRMKSDGRYAETIRSRGPMITDLANSSCSASMPSSPSSESSMGIDRGSVSNRSELPPSFWSRFKSFGSHRLSFSSSVSHRSMSSSSTESGPSTSIFNSTPANTEYLDSHIPPSNGFSFDNPAASHQQEVKIYSNSSKALLNLQVDPIVLAA